MAHNRLIHKLRVKWNPRWAAKFIESFLKERSTFLVLGTFKSDQTPTDTEIPQGSPLSPIMFLFFASTVLPKLKKNSSMSADFIDDTNILTWSDSAGEECKILEKLCQT